MLATISRTPSSILLEPAACSALGRVESRGSPASTPTRRANKASDEALHHELVDTLLLVRSAMLSVQHATDHNAAAMQQLAAPNRAIHGAMLAAVSAPAKMPRTRWQIAANIIKVWTMPVLQVLMGAAVVTVGVLAMDIPLIVMGCTFVVAGLGAGIVLLASSVAPHPLDATKQLFERKPHAPDNPTLKPELFAN